MSNEDTTPHDYDHAMLEVLQMLWGKGFLSPGGPAAVRRIVSGIDLGERELLDIGCGIGGPDHVLVSLGAASVTGVDVEFALVEMAKLAAGDDERLRYELVEPEAALPFADASFDVVFTKDAWLHVIDKPALIAEVHRVLRPGGWLAASDWMKGPESYSQDMLDFIELEGIPYRQVTIDAYVEMLDEAGFLEAQTEDDTQWYAALARDEYERLLGELADELTERLGAKNRDHFVENWRMLTKVTASGELRPGRFRATKP